MRAHRAGLVVAGVIVAAACGKGASNQSVFTEPPFTPEVTLAPSATPNAASSQLQFQPVVGTTFVLHVTGFQSGENVTFTITKPDGTSFTGPPHVVGADGTVEARYSPPQAGTYTVTAKGDRGDQATGQFTASGSFTVAPRTSTTTRSTTTHHVTRTPVPTAHHTATPSPTHTPVTTHHP